MPGKRLGLTRIDNKVLKTFFTKDRYKEDDSPYMELIDRWRSSNEIKLELKESNFRTKERLGRLKGFGFLEFQAISQGKRGDSYWYITPMGLYYVLSTINKESHLKKFLRSNKNKIKVFEKIDNQIYKSNTPVIYLTHQIRDYVKSYQYHLIRSFVLNWLNENFGPDAYMKPLMSGALWNSSNEEYLWQNAQYLLKEQLKK